MLHGEQIIKRGEWMYDGSVPAAVVITRGAVFFGSGDYEDPPDDRDIQTFRVWFESPPGSGAFPAGGGQFFSIEDAVNATSKLLPAPVRWE